MPDTPANPILRDRKQFKVTDSWHAYQQERILHNMKEEYCAVLDIHSDLKYPLLKSLLIEVMPDQVKYSNFLMDQRQLIHSYDIKQRHHSSDPIHQH